MPDVKEPSLKDKLFKLIVIQSLQSGLDGPSFQSEEKLQEEVTRLKGSSDKDRLSKLVKLQTAIVRQKTKYEAMTDKKIKVFISERLNYDIAKKALSELEENDKKKFVEIFCKKLVSLVDNPEKLDIFKEENLMKVDAAIYRRIFFLLLGKTEDSIKEQANAEYIQRHGYSLLGQSSIDEETKALIRKGELEGGLNETNKLLIQHLRSMAKKLTIIHAREYFYLEDLINKELESGTKLRNDPLAQAMFIAIEESYDNSPHIKIDKLWVAEKGYYENLTLDSIMTFLQIASEPRGCSLVQKKFAETKSVETFFEQLSQDENGVINDPVVKELHVIHAMNKTISALKNKPFSEDKLNQLREDRKAYIQGDCDEKREESLKNFLVAAGEMRFCGNYADSNSINVFYQSIPDHIQNYISNVVDNNESATVNIRGFELFKQKLRNFKYPPGKNSSSENSASNKKT